MTHQFDINFNRAVNIILAHEGGYVDNPKDPGGETNFGISKRSYPNLDIKNLTADQAKSIYYTDFWLKLKCNALPYAIALMLFDYAVNSGPKTAVQSLQIAMKFSSDDADGIMGPLTARAVNSHPNKEDLCWKYLDRRQAFLTALPTFKDFGRGWLKRTNETIRAALKGL